MRIHLPRIRSELTVLNDWLPPLTCIASVSERLRSREEGLTCAKASVLP